MHYLARIFTAVFSFFLFSCSEFPSPTASSSGKVSSASQYPGDIQCSVYQADISGVWTRKIETWEIEFNFEVASTDTLFITYKNSHTDGSVEYGFERRLGFDTSGMELESGVVQEVSASDPLDVARGVPNIIVITKGDMFLHFSENEETWKIDIMYNYFWVWGEDEDFETPEGYRSRQPLWNVHIRTRGDYLTIGTDDFMTNIRDINNQSPTYYKSR